MRRYFLLVSLAALPLAAQTASLRGVAVDGITGLPIPRAHVTIRSGSGPNQHLYGALTGPDGAFSIENIIPAEYDGFAERVGYVGPQSGRPQSDTHLTLQPGDNKTNYTLKLTPTGGIVGRVLDSNGEPVEGAQVIAGDAPESRLAASTDETGKATAPRQHTTPEIRTDGTEEFRHGTTYFPSRVEVRPGANTAGVEIRLTRIPFVRVSGRVTGIPPGAGHSYVNAEEGLTASSSAAIAGDGTFELWPDPGSYRLRAHAGNGMVSAPMEIEVGSANLDNLELRVLPLANISGHLEFDDDQVKKPRAITLIEYGSGKAEAPALVAPDNTFRFGNIPAGRYRVNVTSDTAYVKSVRLGSDAAEGSLIDVIGVPAELSVRLSSATASVSGIVKDASGPAKDTRVTLIGPDLSIRNRTVLTASDGSYSFDRVPPGLWKLTAGNPDEDPSGEAIELHPSDRVSKDLRLSPER